MASQPRTSRRRWSDTFKKRIVAEASQPGVTVAQVAHRYDLDAKRISNWKTKFGSGVTLMPVEVTTDDDRFSMSADQSRPGIEIDLPCGTRVRCDAGASTELVSDIIAALRSKR
jgi:transposase